jgi:hypothetical protein
MVAWSTEYDLSSHHIYSQKLDFEDFIMLVRESMHL